MAIQVEKLTLGEVAKIEELSGQSISAIGEEDSPKGLTLAALAFVAKRREDPKFTWNQAQSLTFDDANEILGLDDSADDEADPTVPPQAETGTETEAEAEAVEPSAVSMSGSPHKAKKASAGRAPKKR